MKIAIIALALMLSTAAMADPIDDAEAQRRGVPVQQIQLETANTRIAALEKQVIDLKAKIAELQKNVPTTMAATAPKAATVAATIPAVAPEITAAIKAHKIVNGMTVDQAGKAVGVTFSEARSGSDGSVYTGAISKQTPIGSVGGRLTGGDITGTEYTLHVDTGGRITSWESKPFTASGGSFGVGN